MFPPEIQNFINVFSRLPAIGPRQALRLAFYIISLPKQSFRDLVLSVSKLQEIVACERCFFATRKGEKLCHICVDSSRDRGVVIVVERETDIISLERAGVFKGTYFILGGTARRGIIEESHKERIKKLQNLAKNSPGGKFKELIIALESNSFGDFTAGILKEEMKGCAEKITRLGRGIPTGGEIEFADEETLRSSLENRK